MKLSVFIVLALCAGMALGDTWAVLLAGSNGFWNYRHQSDVCHAYQVLHKNGVPDDHIITMYYDDIANSPSNPYPGKLFNKPTAGAGVDVYAGCTKDYTGNDVSVANFKAVLTGDASAVKGGSGRVLKSNENDTVFINFSDHGGVGIICLPTGELMHADDLNQALQKMYQLKLYKELVFYLEACESGSMFEGLLPNNINIYVTTASNAEESSWGTYCPPQDSVNGKEIGSCLGDLYSVNWMENTDALSNVTAETLQQQFEIIKNLTSQSHVMQYGQLSIASEPVSNFLSHSGARYVSSGRKISRDAMKSQLIDARDTKLHFHYYQYLRAADPQVKQAKWEEYMEEVHHRERSDKVFAELTRRLAGSDTRLMSLLSEKHTPTHWDCIKQLNAAVDEHCNLWSDYSRKYTRTTVNICESGFDVNNAMRIIKSICSE